MFKAPARSSRREVVCEVSGLDSSGRAWGEGLVDDGADDTSLLDACLGYAAPDTDLPADRAPNTPDLSLRVTPEDVADDEQRIAFRDIIYSLLDNMCYSLCLD